MRKTILILAFLGVSITIFSQSITDGLQGWYPFNGNTNDESSNNYNGVVHGAVLTTDRFLNANSAYSFDGIDDFIELPESFDYAERTYSAWFSANNIIPHNGDADGNAVVNCDHNDLQYGPTKIRLVEIDDVDYLRFNYGGYHVHVSIELNVWYLATITVSDSGRYYFNDSLVATVPWNDFSSTNGYPFATIGVNRNNRAFMDGKIDDVRFYDRALSLEEIEMLNGMGTNSVNNLPQNEKLKVFPNPTGELLNIETTQPDQYSIEINSLNGQLLFNDKMKGTFHQIDVSLFQQGVYYITIRSKGFVIVKKIIKL